MREWEQGDKDSASLQKNLLEQEQRDRKKALKDIIPEPSLLEKEDSKYYRPKFFKKAVSNLTGEEVYFFNEYSEDEHTRSYWADREQLDWSHVPKIFEKDCKPFY